MKSTAVKEKTSFGSEDLEFLQARCGSFLENQDGLDLRMSNEEWAVGVQEGLIRHKYKMIRFLNSEITQLVIQRERADGSEEFEINHEIAQLRDYMNVLRKSIDFNREVINVARGKGGVPDHLLSGNGNRAAESEGTGEENHKQDSKSGQGNGRVRAWGIDSSIGAYETWENPFLPDIDPRV